jgi:2-polyprenyl-6-methoxyphenol hydroxylase-like FAD-dependent oxidoreductase
MSTFIVECSPQTWQGLGFDTMDADRSLRQLERLFADYLRGHRLLSHSSAGESLPWLNFRNLTNGKWHTGNLALLGDAAHTTHFSIGSGTRLAMQDAIALADNLVRERNIQAALTAYESERQLAMLRPQREARLSAAWFENIPRYATLDGPQLFALLLDRRSRIIPHIPPRLYYALHRAKRIPLVRMLYRWAAMGIEQLSGWQRRLLHP